MLALSELNEKFIDRPSPSLLLVVPICVVMILGILAVMIGFYLTERIERFGAIFIISSGLVALIYTVLTLLALGMTRYRLDQTGIDIRFGIWHRFYAWQELTGFYQQKGFFAAKVNLPGATPCVRLTDAVVLKMKNGKVLYLTPKDSSQMLEKLSILTKALVPSPNVTNI